MVVDGKSQLAAVTGAAGFIGAALCHAWVARGWRVRALDLAPPARLQGLIAAGSVEFMPTDIRDAAAVAAALAGADVVLHLAGIVGVDRYLTDPCGVLATNLGGTVHVLAACSATATPVVFASTSEVYGDQTLDLAEDTPCRYTDLRSPRWSYALSKAAAEQVVQAHARAGLPATIVRYFNVYGPGMDISPTGRVLGRFVGALQRGEPLQLVGGGAAVRSFCYIDDAVTATLAVADLALRGAAPAAPVFNIGNREPVTIAAVAQLLGRLTGGPVATEVTAGSQTFGAGFVEIARRVPDLTALQRATGFVAQTPLHQGLMLTLRHFGISCAPAAPTERKPIPMVRCDFAPPAALLDALGQCLQSGAMTNGGPQVQALEAQLAALCGARHAVAVSSGWAALVLALRCTLQQRHGANLRGMQVALPAFTFAATRNAVQALGMEPVWCDIDRHSWTLDPVDLQRLFEQHPRVVAVVPVNVFGVPAPIAAITAIAEQHGAKVVCDDAHALGTATPSSHASGLAAARAVSLHATKLVPAGEGGALLTDDAIVAALARRLKNHGLDPPNLPIDGGYNFKLSELHAVVARHSLATLPQRLHQRQSVVPTLLRGLDLSHWQPQRVAAGVAPNYQNLGLLWRGRQRQLDALLIDLAARGVEARRYFWPALHRRGAAARALPATDAVAGNVVCLPLHCTMPLETAAHMADALALATRTIVELPHADAA